MKKTYLSNHAIHSLVPLHVSLDQPKRQLFSLLSSILVVRPDFLFLEIPFLVDFRKNVVRHVPFPHWRQHHSSGLRLGARLLPPGLRRRQKMDWSHRLFSQWCRYISLDYHHLLEYFFGSILGRLRCNRRMR
jgi:hypothetical protein